MKIFFIACLLLLPVVCFSQTLKLEISNPQPRLGQYFDLSINPDTIGKAVFGSLSGQFEISSYNFINSQQQMLSVTVKANKTGKNRVGPFTLTLNGKKYVTDKIDFEIVDSLPYTNKGLWIRKVAVNDSTFYILIDQKTPTLTYVTHKGNSISTSAKTNNDDVDTEFETDSVQNIKSISSSSSTETNSVFDGSPQFKYSFHIYKFVVTDKTKAIILTKNNFSHLPDYYKFTNISIQ